MLRAHMLCVNAKPTSGAGCAPYGLTAVHDAVSSRSTNGALVHHHSRSADDRHQKKKGGRAQKDAAFMKSRRTRVSRSDCLDAHYLRDLLLKNALHAVCEREL